MELDLEASCSVVCYIGDGHFIDRLMLVVTGYGGCSDVLVLVLLLGDGCSVVLLLGDGCSVVLLLGDGWRETMSQDRHDRAAASADSSRPRGRPSPYRGQRGGWGPRSSRGRRPQCKSSASDVLPVNDIAFTPAKRSDAGIVIGNASVCRHRN